jgi:hypothetical protein
MMGPLITDILWPFYCNSAKLGLHQFQETVALLIFQDPKGIVDSSPILAKVQIKSSKPNAYMIFELNE